MISKIDNFVLSILHKISNWTYKKFNINNYVIAAGFLVIAFFCSMFIGFMSMRLAEQDTIEKVAVTRKSIAILAPLLFGSLSIFLLVNLKTIGDWLSRKYDLENFDPTFTKFYIFYRWFFVVIYPLSLLINEWWGMLDTLLIGIAILFLSCKPPEMEVRMSKLFRQ